jgi:hypothetical protein
MNPVLIIQVLNALMDVAPKGVSLYKQVTDLLSASDEPGAKEVLARLEATYAESGAAADAAIQAAIDKLPPE